MATDTALQIRGSNSSNSHAVGEPREESLARWATLAGTCALDLLGISRRTLAGMEIAASGAVLINPDDGQMPMILAGDRVRIERSVTVDLPRDALYRSWRESRRLAPLTDESSSDESEPADGGRDGADAMLERLLDWDVELVAERWPECMVWRSNPDALVEQRLTVRLIRPPDGRGTAVQLAYECAMPGGPLQKGLGPLARRFADARTRANVHRFMRSMTTDNGAAAEAEEDLPRAA
jgi:uncharacterized membrane protein